MSNAVHGVNPDILFKGSRTLRLDVLQQYNKAEKAQISDEEKIENLEKIIVNAQKEIQKFKNRN